MNIKYLLNNPAFKGHINIKLSNYYDKRNLLYDTNDIIGIKEEKLDESTRVITKNGTQVLNIPYTKFILAYIQQKDLPRQSKSITYSQIIEKARR